MRITTLGPLAVDGRPVRGERLATVIRELVGARGRSVAAGVLVDAVWQGTPPDDAAGAVQALVSRIRRLGVPVVAGNGGYRMPADQVEVDAVLGRTLVERGQAALLGGDPAAARRAADEARVLFPEVPELEEPAALRLFSDLVAVRAQAALAGEGGFDEDDLRRLAAHSPPDEPAAALLVRVLAAQGRAAEALDVVEQLRAELADRYGTDPSPVIAEAHLALLRGELAVQPARRPRRADLPAAWRRSPTPLLGRERDVTAVTAVLAAGPLVTIVATGGAGKTRLAAEVARSVAASGRTVRVVELAGLRSPDGVLPAVLAAVGGADTAATGSALTLERRVLTPAERLRALAPELDGLLILDNCEHVLDAAAVAVADLLAAAPPDVAVLATSRAPLGLAGEVVHRLAMLPDAEALGLLEARARAGGSTSTWDTSRALDLCHRLDNLPLALELAAARLRHMPIDDILTGLTDRFALLDDALRGLPERHASLWAMVDWSHELLAPGDRALLERLAVIPAPFTAELATSVAGSPDVRRGLAGLVEQSLLALDDGDGGPRYRMLETVREYGEARLGAGAGRDAALAGLVAWARRRAVALDADHIGPGQLRALAAGATDQDNLLAALQWATAHNDEPAMVDVAAVLFHLWTVRGLHLEVADWAWRMLNVDDPVARRSSAILRGRAAGRPLPDADRTVWLATLIGINAGIAAKMRLGVFAQRITRTVLAERPAEVSARRTALAAALPNLEVVDPDESLRGAAELIVHPDPYVQAFGHLLRATLLENSGRAESTAQDAELAYHRFEAAGDHWGMGMAAQTIGHLVGPVSETVSIEWLRRGARHLELVGAAQDARSIRVQLDAQLALTGDPDAEHRVRELAAAEQPEEMDATTAHLGLGLLAWQRQRYDEALGHAEAVARLMAGVFLPVPQPRIMFRVAAAVLFLRVAEAQPSDRAVRQAVEILTLTRDEVLGSHDSPMVGAWALGGAELAAYRGEAEVARELWALGMRTGATVGRLLPQGNGQRLAAALAGDREPLLAGAHRLTMAEINARLRELMDRILSSEA